MKIAIIGAGFTGLSAAYYLSKSGHQVTIFERNKNSGGLAQGFKNPDWLWSLEDYYHHLFTSDYEILDLAKEVGHRINFYSPKTSTWIDNKIYRLDSSISLLKFSSLNLISRLRTGMGLAFLKLNPVWRPFEYFTAKKYIKTIMGNQSWEKLWQPLFVGKFGKFADTISAAWFWSRIYKRSQLLGYPEGGFLSLVNSIENAVIKNGVKIIYEVEIKKIESNEEIVTIIYKNKKINFDKAICTLPTKQFINICPQLDSNFKNLYGKSLGLGAINVILSLKKQFLSDGTYWLNINDISMPYLAVVEHTNLVSKLNYNNEHILYVGNYLSQDSQLFTYTPEQLVDLYTPYLKKINSNFTKKDINQVWVKKAFFAQPIVPVRYSKVIPPLQSPLKNIYLANMQQVYPWDRGTNYAVELGKKVANICITR